jgi:hypothetical protein
MFDQKGIWLYLEFKHQRYQRVFEQIMQLFGLNVAELCC